MDDNREIFEVPGVYENPRRKTLTLALTVYVKCLKYIHGSKVFPHQDISLYISYKIGMTDDAILTSDFPFTKNESHFCVLPNHFSVKI